MSNENRLHFLTEGGNNEGILDWEYSDVETMTKDFLSKNDLQIFAWHNFPAHQLVSSDEWLAVWKDTDLDGLIRIYATQLIEYHLHRKNYEACTSIRNHAVSILKVYE